MVHLLLAVIYLSYISLGLPDSLLGAAWPSMYGEFDVPVSWAGVISTLIAVSTVISSLMSDKLTRMLGTGKVTVISVAMTAAALYGFSVSPSFWLLCLWAVPYGLGAGSVDASLNNYVALHYASRHMSWLHCMWGMGASLGPYIMGYVLALGWGWNMGYRTIAILQIVLTGILVLTLPSWKADKKGGEEKAGESLSLLKIIRVPGAKEAMLIFFCYCSLEQTAGLWGGSYLALYGGLGKEVAARLTGLFFIGITAGRAISGFLTIWLNDARMIRLGLAVGAVGIGVFLYPGGALVPCGLVLLGLGCSPVYPCLMHAAPDYFGADKSQAIIGIQMASAYVGICLMPPLFGIIAQHLSMGLLPFYLLLLMIVMAVFHERLLKKCREQMH